ncbi:MAG: tetratricopeptide repeat protein, partial [Alphaproteobacteria bacterium]|nr:tetratricopeptide repeat protein [Alphaproteobacteria bacterium]
MNSYLNLAIKYLNEGLLEEAEKICESLLNEEPENVIALHLLGLAAQSDENFEKSYKYFSSAASINPEYAPAQDSLGLFFKKAKEYDKACRHLEYAVKLQPENPDYIDNLGTVYHEIGRISDAEKCFRKAINLSNDRAVTYANLGASLLELNKPNEAIEACNKALELESDNPDTLMNRATAMLMCRDYSEGFKQYECRWNTPAFIAKYIKRDIPHWNGEDLKGKSILIQGEQGIGDQIQFARYIPMLLKKNGKVIFECHQSLHRLFSCLNVSHLVDMKADVSADIQVPLLSLPRVFGTTDKNIPADVPYLKVEKRNFLPAPADGTKLKIGIVWAGKMSPRDRSCPFSYFMKIAKKFPVTLYSMQKGSHSKDIKEAENIIDISSQLTDFADTANAIMQMDMVISVDTATFHLAGALGVPVWGLLIYGADWRYSLEDKTTP